MTNRSKILLLGGLTLATVGLAVAWPKRASASTLPEPSAPTKLPGSKPKPSFIPRNGPNGTVLLADLPAECRGYYDVAFGQKGGSGCADAGAWNAEIDRMYNQYLDGDPFFDIERYDEAVVAYERAAAACVASQDSEQEAIDRWVACLRNLGLAPQEVWAA